MPSGAGLCDDRSRDRRAGERYMFDPWVFGQSHSSLDAEPGDDVEHARWKSSGGRELSHAQQRQAGVLSRLDDTGVARGQRAASAPPTLRPNICSG